MVKHGKFELERATRGYRINKLCYSLNRAEARAEFLSDEAAYCKKFDLNPEETEAVVTRDRQRLFVLGGNMYFVAKLDRTKKTGAA
ncbi:MAG: hypothetical protein EP335_00835 [Alphaproteobacteria bacterium]|nr:MAG: hypothetical protein EP335_00835 [Alphaproteobacteria bacterium]